MKPPPEGARWLIRLRYWACAAVFCVVTAVWILGVVERPLPLYLVGCMILVYNLGFMLQGRKRAVSPRSLERNILLQILCDLTALAALLYFADLPRNPFLSYFVFHIIIAGMYLRGRLPVVVTATATIMVGGLMALEYAGLLPEFSLEIYSGPVGHGEHGGLYLLAVFVAFTTTLWITMYFITSIRRYVDRAHAEIHQKEKLLGIGQLAAGIAHQIANPLDGMQNCLQTIGECVKDDPNLTEYVQMMVSALDRIEQTAKRVQSFARPHGMTIESTDVGAVVQGTLQLLGPPPGGRIRLLAELNEVPPVLGDTYTLQEVLLNLCTNAFAAMPAGGTLTIRTRVLDDPGAEGRGSVAIEVADTGVGIPRGDLEKIFEPFFTTRAESGGTGLGLGLCRMLISEMGGRIDVRSTVGEGTVFTVILNPAETHQGVAP